MVDIKEVADKIYRLETTLPGMAVTLATYLIRTLEGVLIEPGPSIAVPRIRQGMNQLGMKALAYIIPTHIHVDHGGGAGALAQLFPAAKVLVHPAGVRHVVDPSRLVESTEMVFGADFEKLFGPIVPVPESQIKVPADNEIISVDGRELQIVYAPGHAPHHIVVFDRSVKGLFCGEALGMSGQGDKLFPLPAVAPPGFDQELYLETMEKLRKLGAQLLFYSHGQVGLEADRLISVAAENTRFLGDMLLESLRNGETPETIAPRIKQHIATRFGVELGDLDIKMTIGGYALYFKKKGLVQ